MPAATWSAGSCCSIAHDLSASTMTEPGNVLLQQAAQLHRQGRRLEAIEIFRQVLATRPESSEGWYELGYLLKAEGMYEDALDAYAQALARGVRRPEEVHLNRAVIYSDHLRRDEDAERELRSALALAPDYVPALLNLGNLHEERGERTLALACYDKVTTDAGSEDQPHQDLRLEALARSAKLRPPTAVDDPLLARLREAAGEPSSKMVRVNLLFALGQAYDRLGEFDLAFDAYAKGNRWLLRQSGRTYDRIRSSRLTDALIESFPPANVRAPGPRVEAGAEPLFICGMFRSGSTLVEQVLASHPQVTAGGELDYLRRLAATQLAPFPASMAAADPVRDAALAEGYRAHLARLFPRGIASTFITDKRPDNFVLIGLIKRLFPSAKIVHTIRNPLDNGLSVFMQHLHLRVAGYSADLGDIGHYYGEYRRLMAHWRALYEASIFEFDYDAFVLEPKATLQRLLDFLDLPWDDRCLDFHRLGNTVKTASYWQVRQPLHANASGRWRHYREHLGPLRRALQEARVAIDEDDR
jgi:tetratricopeptide (TPR) repeat protein